MPYNNVISRTDAAALIPEDVSAEIMNSVAEMNPIMRLARRLPNARRASVANAGHMLPLTHPDDLAALPTAHLAAS